MHSYLVCYDIDDNRERTRTAHLLESYGQRVQYSVFELHLHGDQQRRELQHKLRDILGEDSNEVRFYRLTASAIAASHSLNGEPIARRDLVIII